MKGLGALALIIGICWLVFALSMDVSVAAGGGRVNNLGLMADRQLHAIVGGMIALAGLLIVLLGGKASAAHATAETDTRPCPLCAETIKSAAVKCKHCGAEVEAVAAPALVSGWVASIPCMVGEQQDRARISVASLGMPVAPMTGSSVGAGPFATKDEAKQAQEALRDQQKTYSEVTYWNSDDEMASAPWALAIPCRKQSDREMAIATAELLDLPSLPATAPFIRFGPFLSKDKAGEALRRLTEKGVHGNIEEIREP